MRHFDIIKWLWVAGIIYTFLQGYTFYMQRQGEIAVGCSFLCAFCIFQFIRRLHTLYYLHMKMKNIDKLNGRAFERYLTVQFRHLGYHVTLTSYSHDYGHTPCSRSFDFQGSVPVDKNYLTEKNSLLPYMQEVGKIRKTAIFPRFWKCVIMDDKSRIYPEERGHLYVHKTIAAGTAERFTGSR